MNKPENSTFIRFLKGHSSDEESEIIQNWIEKSAENKQDFERLKSIWNSYGDRSEHFQPDLDKAWGKIEDRVHSDKKLKLSPWIYRIAAVLVLGIGVTFIMQDQRNEALTDIPSLEPTELLAQDEVREVNLPDGSTVSLNKGATISYESAFGIEERRIQLQGEAFFDIKRDEDRPFVIETQSTITEVLGTSFTINPTSESVIVTVVSGKVSFEGSGNEVILTKGEKGNFSKITNSMVESVNDDPNFLAWKTKQLLFEDASFITVARDLERFYGIEFGDTNKSIRRLTASFDDQSLEEVIEVISTTLDVNIEQDNDGKYIIL